MDEANTSVRVTTESKDEKPALSKDSKGEDVSTKKVYRSIFECPSSSDSETNSSDIHSDRASSFMKRLKFDFKDKNYPIEEDGALKGMDDSMQGGPLSWEDSICKEDDCNVGDVMSPEDKERFQDIEKELRILNTAIEKKTETSPSPAAKLYTGPYGQIRSPFKKFSSFCSFSKGAKRSPCHKRRSIIRKQKPETDGDKDDTDADGSDDDDDDSSSDSSSGSSSSSSGSGSSSSSSCDEATTDSRPKKPKDPVKYSLAKEEEKSPGSSDESDDDPDQLAINEDEHQVQNEAELEDGGVLDEDLDKKSRRFALSAMNVKSIIHKIITNENVVEMVRQAVHEELKEKKFDTFEPKMTRSKVKEVFETQGAVPHPWGLSPVKRKTASPTFLDIELPEEEEEEDEDFNPDKVVGTESDDDSESIVSSNYFSDIGSPSTPGTPRQVMTPSSRTPRPSVITPSTRDGENSNSLLSPMGPPSITVVPRSSQLGRKFHDAMERHDTTSQESQEELIAKRTRSKLPLTELSILDIEANFVAPDITADMYDTYCNDGEWKQFLNGLMKSDKTEVLEDSTDTVNEEEDPEYNFLEEAEDEYDQEDFRDDRAVKVSKRELNQLLDNLYDDETFACDPIDEECKKSIKTQTDIIVINEKKKKETKLHQNLVLQIGERERLQIEDQMRKHVQLLATTFVMAQDGVEDHKPVAAGAKLLLLELNKFSEKFEGVHKTTMLRACNLQDAVQLVQEGTWTQEEGQPDTGDTLTQQQLSFKYANQHLARLSHIQMETLWTNPTFLYPDLLPHGGFIEKTKLKKDRSRVRFIVAEDNLLAMGLDQFSEFSEALQFIQMFLLPTKTIKQIQIRIKNLKANASKDNAVKYWKQFKQLPTFSQHVPVFDDSMRVPVKDKVSETSDVPAWCKYFMPGLNVDSGEVKTLRRRKKQDRVSFSHSVPEVSPSSCPDSRPCTPATDISDKQHSSESSLESPKTSKPTRVKRAYRRRSKPESKKQGFVPLPMISSVGPQPVPSNQITILMMDKCVTPNKPAGLTTLATPTLIFFNNQLPVTTPQPVLTPSSVILPATTLPFTTVHVPNSPVTMSPVCPSVINASHIGLTSVTPPLQSPTISGSIPISIVATPEAKKQTDLIADSLRESDIDLGQMISTDAAVPVSESLPSISQSSVVIHDKPPSISSSPISGSSVTLTSIGKIGALSVKTAPLHAQQSDGCKCLQSLDTSESTDCPETLKPSTPQHNVTKDIPAVTTPPSSKSALDLVASYAQYFISPNGSATSQQQLLETTPKKKKGQYVTLAPKPMTPSDQMPVDNDMFRKVRSSPRRKQLQEKVKTILPKGFVISTFDTSPAKKVASNLVDKAMHKSRQKGRHGYFSNSLSQKYRKILPSPLKTDNEQTRSNTLTASAKCSRGQTRKGELCKFKAKTQSGATAESRHDMEAEDVVSDGGMEEEGRVGDEEDKCMDTESDYTQSEDGNDTQEEVEEVEEVEDSQEEVDSQEDDDNHIANLMQASTTLGYDPMKEDIGKLRVGKKDRDRDVTLAMLAPDIIESDPKRDDRDVVFAQAYLHKVKKALKDDLETLEKFLGLMFSFSKADENPVKLYRDLKQLFAPYQELMHEFAGFLLKEQAIECGCYESFLEFHQTRSFLRKIEIYFRQNPHQCQKVMKTLSRWHKKPGRKLQDLRDQVEPLLKGQKHLLEEFSRFFPEERLPEYLMDDFEEVLLDGSDEENDELKNDSFEDIEMMEEEEILGTKRCTCPCHVNGDDTYKKKKKHCYKCCLTVIDGELVYKVNKTTIKRVHVTFGPAVSRISLEHEGTEPVKPTQEQVTDAAVGTEDMECDAAGDAVVSGRLQETLLGADTVERAVIFDKEKSSNDQNILTFLPDVASTQTEEVDAQPTCAATDSSSCVLRETDNNTSINTDETPTPVSPYKAMASDILAVAFNNALLSEVSMDASLSRHPISNLTPAEPYRCEGKDVAEWTVEDQPNSVTKPVPLAAHQLQVTIPGKPGLPKTCSDEPLKVSFGSSFSKVSTVSPPSASITVTREIPSSKDIAPCRESSNHGGESPIFSPFSPFGQEIQALTGMGSPLSLIHSPGATGVSNSTRVAVANKVRRVTPIPVKGSDRLYEESSFQTAVVNSPVLFDTSSKSPFELAKSGIKFQTETSNNTTDIFDKSNKVDTDIGPICLADSTKSDSSKLSQVSSNSKETYPGSDVVSISAGITIIEPNLFSENANKGFPKPQSQPVTALLSEESLFQCLNKQPSFSDTLHSISNLTNILHALDERTLPGVSPKKLTQSSGKSSEVSSDSSNSVTSSDKNSEPAMNVESQVPNNSEGNNLHVIKEEKDLTSKIAEPDKIASAGSSVTTSETSSDSVDSVDGGRTTSDRLEQSNPTSVQSVDNLERLPQPCFTMSHMSITDKQCDNKDNPVNCLGSGKTFESSNLNTQNIASSGCGNVDNSDDNVRKELVSEHGSQDNIVIERKRKHKSKHKKDRKSKYQKTEEGTNISHVELTDSGNQSCLKSPVSLNETKHSRTSSEEPLTQVSCPEETRRLKREQAGQGSTGGAEVEKTLLECQTSQLSPAPTSSAADSGVTDSSCTGTTTISSELEPVWSRKTDKMILVGCKKRGIKDRTFARLAKKIGTVSPEQVKKRFGYLYEMIFHCSPF